LPVQIIVRAQSIGEDVMLKFLALLAVCGVAQAQTYPTITPLQNPVLTYNYQEACVPGGFNLDGSVWGVCHTHKYRVCSGRACHPTTYTDNYITTWDINGIVQHVVLCDETVSNPPHATLFTYFNGYTSCPVAAPNPLGEVTYIQYGPYGWQYSVYYYVGASPDGVYGLVDNAVVYPAPVPVPQT
jgi:hypothetical protein